MYRIFDLALESDVPLPELDAASAAAPDLLFTVARHRTHGADHTDLNDGGDDPEWFHHWRDRSGRRAISCARLEDSFLMRFPDLADFVVDHALGTIQCRPRPQTSGETIRHLLLDRVIPRLLGQQGRLVLHASAVVVSGEGVAFLGRSGEGKSTLAASFLGAGCELLADDCLLVEAREGEVIGQPSYSGSRLWPDSASELFPESEAWSGAPSSTNKKRLILHRGEATGFSLGAFFLLQDQTEVGSVESATEVTIEPLRGVTALMALIGRSFLLDASDTVAAASQFEQVSHVARSGAPVYRLTYPRDHELLPAVREAVAACVTERQPALSC